MTAPKGQRDAIRTRNRTARAAAVGDPVGVAERLAVLSWLADQLDAWPSAPWDAEIPPFEDGREHPAWTADRAATCLAQVRVWDRLRHPDPERFRDSAARRAVEALAALPEAPDSKTGLSLLAAAVDRLPPVVRATEHPNPLLPVVRVRGEAPEREAGRLAFGGILDVGDPAPGQLALFPAPDGPRVALLELTDAYGVPTMAQGRGAPLELAVYVGACILTPHHFRAGRARLVTTVRELRAFLFGARWKPTRGDRPGDWERVREAALHASSLWLPVPHPSGAPDLWRAVAVRKIPPADYDPSYLDREVIFDVELPPGAADGPPIDREELSRLRRVSGPRFRAYLAARSVVWRPGVTRVRHPGNRRPIWTRDPSRYPVLTAEDRDRLAFGLGWEDRRRKEGRRKADAHWERLPGCVVWTKRAATPDGRQGWRILPTEAADAIKRRDG